MLGGGSVERRVRHSTLTLKPPNASTTNPVQVMRIFLATDAAFPGGIYSPWCRRLSASWCDEFAIQYTNPEKKTPTRLPRMTKLRSRFMSSLPNDRLHAVLRPSGALTEMASHAGSTSEPTGRGKPEPLTCYWLPASINSGVLRNSSTWPHFAQIKPHLATTGAGIMSKRS